MMTTPATTANATDMPVRRRTEVGNAESGTQPSKTPRMVRLTVNLPSRLVDQMRDAVYWTPGLTLAWLIARAVQASLTELEAIHQGPFPKRLKPLRAGRPRLLGQAMTLRPVGADQGGNGTTSGVQGAVRLPTQPKPQRVFDEKRRPS